MRPILAPTQPALTSLSVVDLDDALAQHLGHARRVREEDLVDLQLVALRVVLGALVKKCVCSLLRINLSFFFSTTSSTASANGPRIGPPLWGF